MSTSKYVLKLIRRRRSSSSSYSSGSSRTVPVRFFFLFFFSSFFSNLRHHYHQLMNSSLVSWVAGEVCCFTTYSSEHAGMQRKGQHRPTVFHTPKQLVAVLAGLHFCHDSQWKKMFLTQYNRLFFVLKKTSLPKNRTLTCCIPLKVGLFCKQLHL